MQAGASDRSPRFGSFDGRISRATVCGSFRNPPALGFIREGARSMLSCLRAFPLGCTCDQIYARADWTTVGLVGSRTKV